MVVIHVENGGGHILLEITCHPINWLEKDNSKDFIHNAPTALIYKVKVLNFGLLF